MLLENEFVSGTYKKILAEIAATALEKADIHFNEEVVFFDTHSDLWNNSSPSTTIHTRNGLQNTYDDVIITTPLGWLKRHKHDAFPSDSPLPFRLQEAVDNVSYGRLEKVYITFSKAFWQQDVPSTATSSGFSNSEPFTNILTPAEESSTSTSPSMPSPSPQSNSPTSNSTTSSSSASSSSKYDSSPWTYPTFTHFLEPDYILHPPQTLWNQSLVNLAAFPDSTAHPTLLFYLYGDCATHVVNLFKDLSVSNLPHSPYYNALNSFFESYYSHLPNYNPSFPDCTPTAFLATKWQLDPFAGNGSYTNFQIELENGDKDIEVMREGMGEEKGLWLAGEHTAPFIALGTTTGAYWSGEGVARRIVALYDTLKIAEEVVSDEVEEQTLKKVPNFEKRDGENVNALAL
jgi:Flavin containing amine oxidoreductase